MHTHTQKSLSRVRLFVTPWTVAHQAPRSMRFSRHEYWSGLPLRKLKLRQLSSSRYIKKSVLPMMCFEVDPGFLSLGPFNNLCLVTLYCGGFFSALYDE